MDGKAATEARRFLGVSAPEVGADEIAEVLDSIRNGWLTTGPKVAIFENKLADYLGVPFVRCLNSCTAGLTLALRVLDVGPGDEILVPAMTFVSCANVVVHLGAQPVLVDCEPLGGSVDLADAERKLTQRTRAMMPVHLGGLPLDMDAMGAFAERHDIALVEDAAHAIGAEWRGRRVGAHGHLTAFSFHATKNITTAEGGALAIQDEEVAERVRRLSLHGLTRTAWARHGDVSPAAYDVPEPGFKFAMHDISAAIGIHQLARLDDRIRRRRELADLYDHRLQGLPLELPPRPPAHARHAHHLYAIRVPRGVGVDRDDLARELIAHNIGTSVHFRAIHLHSWYRERLGVRAEDLPVATDWSGRSLTLPLSHVMTDEDVEHVANALESILL